MDGSMNPPRRSRYDATPRERCQFTGEGTVMLARHQRDAMALTGVRLREPVSSASLCALSLQLKPNT